MNVADMIRDAEAELQHAETDDQRAEEAVLRAQAARAATLAEVTRMRGVLDWLHQHAGQPQERITPAAGVPAPSTPRFGNPARGVTLADTCYRALEELGRRALTADVRLALKRAGHDLEQKQVRGSLKYLKRKGRIEGEDGTWWLPRTSVLPPAAPVGVPAMNGARWES